MRSQPALIVLAISFAAITIVGWRVEVSAKPEPAAPEPATKADTTFQDKIAPFMQKYCLSCHNGVKAAGGLTLEGYVSEAHARKDRKTWANVQHVLASGDMPPKKKDQPTKDEREFVINWIQKSLTHVDCTAAKDPGRVTLRRLNRSEYNNTLRDLCGVDLKPADEFPADDVGYGFDNIGDVLSLPPVLLEKYLAAADKVLNAALVLPEKVVSSKQTFRPQTLLATPRTAKTKDGNNNKIIFTTAGTAFLEKFNFPAEGEYVMRVKGWGTNVGGEYPKVVFRVNESDLKTVTYEGTPEKPQLHEFRGKVTAGEKQVKVAFVNPFEDKNESDAAKKFRQFGVASIEIEGPFNPVPKPDSASVKLLLVARPTGAADQKQAAERVLSAFARRAYRRPVTASEVARLMKLFDISSQAGEPFEKAIRLPMKAILVSPNFLFMVEEDPKDVAGIRTVSDLELATRLSYFIWSSMPDEELLRLAERNELRKPGALEAQVTRMIKHPNARSLSENFAGQWLQLRMLKTLTPDKGIYPGYDDTLKAAMIGEAEAFFEHVVKEDRPILDFLDADYTFVNDRLAKHYGLTNVSGSGFRKVKLPDSRRGGILTMASTLTVTSNPTRTSPVKRGKWVLENILGTPPPPPAPDVPELPATGELKGTLRQQMEQHRANPSCATCHSKLDPLGFGLENFDGIGGWRTVDNKLPIDSTGVLPDGMKFQGPAELRQVLLKKSDLFRRCFAEKLLTFAAGRGLEYYDKCSIDEIVAKSLLSQNRFSAFVSAVVQSDPFQKRKATRSE